VPFATFVPIRKGDPLRLGGIRTCNMKSEDEFKFLRLDASSFWKTDTELAPEIMADVSAHSRVAFQRHIALSNIILA